MRGGASRRGARGLARRRRRGAHGREQRHARGRHTRPHGIHRRRHPLHEPLRAWVDDEGLHRVQWGDARDGRRVAATPAKGAANVKDAVACVAAELARRVRENVDPVLPQLPPRRPPRRRGVDEASTPADDETAARAPTADARRTPRRSCDEDRTAFAHCATRAVCGTREEAPCDPWRAGRSTRTPSRAETRATASGRRRARARRARARREGGIDRRRRRGGR